jgi:hypothetical protein
MPAYSSGRTSRKAMSEASLYPGGFDGDVPFGVGVVQDQVIDALFRRRDHHRVPVLAEAEQGIHGVENFRGVADDEENFAHRSVPGRGR